MELKPTIFEFVSYDFIPQEKRVFLNYKQEFSSGDPIFYTETLILPEIPNLNLISKDLLDKILQGIHLVSGVSYYKFYCATKVKTNYKLTKGEASFWNKLYKSGLGEFYYRNNLDPNKAPKFQFDSNAKPQNYELERNNKCLIGFSGGKDSIVALELLKEQGITPTAFFVETQKDSDLINNAIKGANIRLVKIKRLLDQKVYDEHKYNGHIPISAIYAFIGILYSVLYKYSYFIVANEHSSNFGNIKYKGEIINHQWSKSSEFENLFRDYVDNYISSDVKYFSLLRPFYEIRIAEMFSKYKEYFNVFSSCNKNFKTVGEKMDGFWCCECPKCIFAFTMFSAFLDKEELINIFGKNLYKEEKLLPLFKDIFGFGKIKPFDCVGTFEESRIAFKIASEKFENDFIIKNLVSKIKIKKEDIKEIFKPRISENIPEFLKFSGMKNILILGYGKEGEISKKYIEKYFPNLKVGTADKKDDKKYLEKQKDFDIAIKTPGIQKKLVKIPYTTATNIFFSKIKKLGNKTIGITGSKGKSTTASLVYNILNEAGKKVKILGNIGNPMLEVLMEPIAKDEIFVLELSSYQLDDIKFSPNIAVITNLFPEHMNYHSGLENYYISKKNIINFQQSKDVFIYNQKNKMLCNWAKNSRAKVVPFSEKTFLADINVPLIGEHNRENILAAVSVAREFGIENKIIKRAIEKFIPLPHRLEFVGNFRGINFYDDAISTTPESTIMAIKSLKNIDTIFLGGEDRGYDFSDLEKTIKKYKIRNIVLFPNSGKRILKFQKGLNILETKNMQKAVEFAYKNTKPGYICLLSCASPSYSLWKNFEEKGEQFVKAVKNLK